MYPKHFLEKFWGGEQKNQLFVGAAFNDSINETFPLIDKVARKIGFERAFRVGVETEANSIPEIIFDSIANSKMILFDLSDDNRFPENSEKRFSKINQNVIYELGIATTIREPSDIVLIRKRTNEPLNLPFDIQHLHINIFDDKINDEFIERVINESTKKQIWHRDRRVQSVIESLDERGLTLMNSYGRIPKGHNHFHSTGNLQEKNSLFRLIDLGIVRFACSIWSAKGFEYAYHWTDLGYKVMNFLGIKQMDEEEFTKSSIYESIKSAEEDFYRTKENAFKK